MQYVVKIDTSRNVYIRYDNFVDCIECIKALLNSRNINKVEIFIEE